MKYPRYTIIDYDILRVPRAVLQPEMKPEEIPAIHKCNTTHKTTEGKKALCKECRNPWRV